MVKVLTVTSVNFSISGFEIIIGSCWTFEIHF